MNQNMTSYMPARSERIWQDLAHHEAYLFDLNGYLIVRDAVDPGVLDAVNRRADEVQAEAGMTSRGIPTSNNQPPRLVHRLDNPIATDPAFMALAMSPKVLSKIVNFVVYPKLKSNWLDFKARHGSIGFHSNHTPYIPVDAYHFHGGQIHCNLVTVCYALADVPPGGAALEVIPGSHKANFPLPPDDTLRETRQELPLRRGDALIFTHDMNHGSYNQLDYVRRTFFSSFSTGFSSNTQEGDSLYDSAFSSSPEGSWQKYLLRRPKGDRDTYPQPSHRVMEEEGLGKLAA
jgi:ectoine hydroxylase-related dioxygenase (phytanoyl-CoA dioxygenase family)